MTESDGMAVDAVSPLPLSLPDSVSGADDCREWFVMTSANPGLVEECLLTENGRRKSLGRAPFRFFVPYRFLERRVASGPEPDGDGSEYPENSAFARESNALRAALRRYIFIKSDRLELHRLLTCCETRDAFSTLWWLRDRGGRCVTVPTPEMERFIDACCDMRVKFEICSASPGLKCGEPVLLKVKGFEGRKAWVIDVRRSGGTTELVCGFYILAETAVVKLRHLRPEDVMTRWDGGASAREYNDYKFIEDVQRKVFRLITNRMCREGAGAAALRRDATTLERLNGYRYRSFPTFPLTAKYYALMLLCSILSGDPYSLRRFLAKSAGLLGEISGRRDARVPKDAVAYLHSALYAATGDLSLYERARRYFISLPRQTSTHRMLLLLMEEREAWAVSDARE